MFVLSVNRKTGRIKVELEKEKFRFDIQEKKIRFVRNKLSTHAWLMQYILKIHKGQKENWKA